jgi:anaerobic selenocysteine-containing dehydrogenase
MPAVTQFDDDDDLLRSVIKRSRVSLDELKAAPSGVVVEDLPRWDWMIPDHVPKGRLDLAPDPLVNELRTWAVTTNQERDRKDEAEDDEDAAGRQLSLICRRLPHQINSDLQELPSQQRAPYATLLMSEPDARRRGIANGDSVIVANGNGATQAIAEITDRIRPGVVSLPHSWRNPVVNRLTSTENLDPLTGMPRYTAIGVHVSREPST